MDPILVDLLVPVFGLITVGTFSLIGLKMYLAHRGRGVRGPAADEVARLARDLTDVRAQLEGVRGDVGELYERVEFAERMLTKGREAREE